MGWKKISLLKENCTKFRTKLSFSPAATTGGFQMVQGRTQDIEKEGAATDIDILVLNLRHFCKHYSTKGGAVTPSAHS